MGELLDMDVVNVPTFHGFQAAATAVMANSIRVKYSGGPNLRA
jgi:hypothetical protein